MNSQVPALTYPTDCAAATALAPMVARNSGDECNRRGFLDDFLMAALNRTFALAQVDRRAMGIGEHLKLDVARILQIFLEQHGVVAKRRLRFALCGC